ncbi:probable LRR receptor-like serine/threonine-protein kinase At3g47570 isoform X2 [Ziziphus jujuba]|uniref:Probable LRR receptor-like serine/threonine-protein kinase At3g47570 isoform X2 n=1 Tax=Ziziphus jujuba TaxID=326968 RepID=A0ABM4ABM1_ZIZJJ|nr:probable LRR receptor-like serine/threonine-protein kinase At3g47570 isoform X2 [Ziziphus jujuba]
MSGKKRKTDIMDHSYFYCRWVLSMFFQCGIILFCMNVHMETASSAPSYGNESDHLALLDLKNKIIQDPLGIMNSWNDSIHFCNWVGITCNPSSQRVLVLNLRALRLGGSIPPSIGNLTYLTEIHLQNNSFHGEIPQEMGHLLQLQRLNLSYNSFVGKIPTNITHCKELRYFNISDNKLAGPIPVQFSSLSKLVGLDLSKNNLTGSIPAWIGNFTSLYSLLLRQNNFQGSIPEDLGHLTSLGRFILAENNLSDIGFTLPNLQIYAGGVNRFNGPIPISLTNCSQLQKLDFAQNYLSGTLPENIGSLNNLNRLNFDNNLLGNRKSGDLNFLSSLANCTVMEVLGLAYNNFGGELPRSIANLSSHMSRLTIGGNILHGSIPNGIGNLVDLTILGLETNRLGGTVPEVIGKFHKLQGLYLRGNMFSGSIPFSLGNLTSLSVLFLEENKFEGSIPHSLGNCTYLMTLNLSCNSLSGNIPREVIGLSSLTISLSLSQNSLRGSLPSEVGVNLEELDLSENKLSGQLPSNLGKCLSLERLHLEGNEFEGAIPQTLESLRGLEEMDVSRNNLSGLIPKFLGELSTLKFLNLSYNNFEGELPSQGIFSNATAVSVLGNDKLCGGIPKLLLPPCLKEKSNSTRKIFSRKVVIPVTCAAILLAIILCFLVGFSKWRPVTKSSTEDWQASMSYSDLFQSTDGFSENNLIGSGSFGSVYKGVLSRYNKIVAIKVLNLQLQGASRSFLDECNALRSIRHRNLLKIITACSSIDHQGNDFKSLVFEFMANGSLEQWLHPRDNDEHLNKRLSLIQRLNIAIDVASALGYLHHDCETPIVHCDLKPSNVLLDEDMVSHVGDFGLAKLLFEASDNPSKSQTMSASLRGSIGYIPPEYGMGGQVSILGDIYSYGILLLEMFTGKRPTDDMFKDGLSIHQFVAMALPNHVMDIVDPSLLLEDDDGEENENDIEELAIIEVDRQVNAGRRANDCLVSVMQIGVMCSKFLPGERMLMNAVVNKMQAIRESYLKCKKSENMNRF